MSKTKTPFLSLGAHGSVGGSITAQKRNSATLLRKKPLPANPRSLGQTYQRWLYQDYSYLWLQQSAGTRAQYRTAGARFHLTAFQYWMKVMLTTLPDITGYWKLDDNTGTTTIDSSRNENHGTIIGASPATGLIDRALDFDALNDRIVVPHAPSLDLTEDATFEAIIYPIGWGKNLGGRICSKGTLAAGVYQFFIWSNLARFGLKIGASLYTSANFAITLSTWHHLAVTWDYFTGTFRYYLNGAPWGTTARASPIPTNTLDLWIGDVTDGSRTFNGIIDQLIIYNRTLDEPTILRHSERRYPL